MEKKQLCKDYMYNSCKRDHCRFLHKENVCFHFWKNGFCKLETNCEKSHEFTKNNSNKENEKHTNQNNKENEKHTNQNNKENKKHTNQNNKENKKHTNQNNKEKGKRDKSKYNKKKIKNTVCFDPMKDPVDIRISYDLGKNKSATTITSREVLLVPNLFSNFEKGEIYNKLVYEIENCGIPQEQLLKLWHGDTHFIADDHLAWKQKCPTFKMVIDKIQDFFDMDIKATRFNWYQDTIQWKPFHHDAAAVKRDKMDTQNFTVGISFGATREAAFENAKTGTTISIPQPDGCIYAFAKETNIIWRHGILQDIPPKNEGRISIIAWGWIDNQISLK